MPLRDLTESEIRQIFRPVVAEMLSQQKDSTMSVSLDVADKVKLRNFLVTHTLVVLLIMGAFFFFLDRRMLTIEIQQSTVIKEVNELRQTPGVINGSLNASSPK